MSPIYKELGIDRLSPAQQLLLVEEIWDHLADERPEAMGLTAEQEMELDRRLDAHEANPQAAIPWSEARRQLWNHD